MNRRKQTLAWLLVLFTCPLAVAAPASAVAGSASGSWKDTKTGLAINYPTDWHVTTRKLTTITEPVQRFVVYSGSVPNRLVQRASPKATQALAIVMEQTSVSVSDLKHFPPRPRRFSVSHLRGIESFAGDQWAERVFREDGRAFYLFIWVGAKDRSQLPTLLSTLDSLRVF